MTVSLIRAPSYCHTAAFTRLHAAKVRETRKCTKYRSLAAKEDCKFVPFVLESYGGFGTHAKGFMDELTRQSKDHAQPSVIRFRDYATRALSICLLNGNCFVLHNGCLRLREWDGKYRRDRRRQASRQRPALFYRPVPSLRSSSPLPDENIRVNLSVLSEEKTSIDLSISDEPPVSVGVSENIRVNLIIPSDSQAPAESSSQDG